MFFKSERIGAGRRNFFGVNNNQPKRERAKSGDGRRAAPGSSLLRMEGLEDRALLSAVLSDDPLDLAFVGYEDEPFDEELEVFWETL